MTEAEADRLIRRAHAAIEGEKRRGLDGLANYDFEAEIEQHQRMITREQLAALLRKEFGRDLL